MFAGMDDKGSGCASVLAWLTADIINFGLMTVAPV